MSDLVSDLVGTLLARNAETIAGESAEDAAALLSPEHLRATKSMTQLGELRALARAATAAAAADVDGDSAADDVDERVVVMVVLPRLGVAFNAARARALVALLEVVAHDMNLWR